MDPPRPSTSDFLPSAREEKRASDANVHKIERVDAAMPRPDGVPVYVLGWRNEAGHFEERELGKSHHKVVAGTYIRGGVEPVYWDVAVKQQCETAQVTELEKEASQGPFSRGHPHV
jgi:hypothetical protein